MQILKAGTWIKSKGFTLIEVLAALSVAAIGMLGLIQLQLTSMNAANKADQTMQATLLAQSLMAEAIAQGIDREKRESGTDTSTSPHLYWDLTVDRDSALTARLRARQPVYRIEARIRWGRKSGRTLTLSRLYSPTPSP